MLHSVWLGDNPKSELLCECEASWPALRHEVTDWLPRMSYETEALAARHWAGLSDVVRLWQLFEYGGIYVDADVEICDSRALTDFYMTACRDGKTIVGAEDVDDMGAPRNLCGAVIIAPRQHPFIARMLDVYSGLAFSDTFNGAVNGTTLLTREAAGRDDVLKLSSGVFHPVHYSIIKSTPIEERRRIAQRLGSTTLHHFSGSWVK